MRTSSWKFRFVLLPAVGFLACSLSTWTHAQSVTLAWDPSPTPNVEYVVRYGTQPGTYTELHAAGTNTLATITGLQLGTIYYFVVAATQSGRESDFSNQVAFDGRNLVCLAGVAVGEIARITFRSFPSEVTELQATENFLNWTVLRVFPSSASIQSHQFSDTNATVSGGRFYRLFIP
jgi:hypothetical protein